MILSGLSVIIKILIAAAVIPAILLLKFVYNSDHLEKESGALLIKLVFAGIISTIIAIIGENVGSMILGMFFSENSLIYAVLMYFVVVGLSEEGGKYIVMKKRTWDNPEFNCQFDGVVYAVFVSLGFALWENIKYVMSFGLGTALVRAVTAVPGHACFGVFMGCFYGLARKAENYGDSASSKLYRKLALIVPVIMHGAYDFIATNGTEGAAMLFFAFVVGMFLICYKLVKKLSRNDQYIR